MTIVYSCKRHSSYSKKKLYIVIISIYGMVNIRCMATTPSLVWAHHLTLQSLNFPFYIVRCKMCCCYYDLWSRVCKFPNTCLARHNIVWIGCVGYLLWVEGINRWSHALAHICQFGKSSREMFVILKTYGWWHDI